MKSTTRRSSPTAPEPYWLYGLHSVRAALENPQRRIHRMIASRNALNRLGAVPPHLTPEIADVRAINKLLGDAVHQGVALWVDPLPTRAVEDLNEASAVLLLDHITDPHNTGAVLRSAVAFGIDAVITTTRHSAQEGGVLAKSASGAVDLLPIVEVVNLSRAVDALQRFGFHVAALDSEAEVGLSSLKPAPKWAFVLGAEGKGVRHGVRETCGITARIEVPGALASLNVSNAAAITLYEMRRRLLTVD